MKSQFETAILKEELFDFAIGRDAYLAPDPDWGDHLVIRSYGRGVFQMLEDKGLHEVVYNALVLILELLLQDKTLPEHEKLALIVQHFVCFEGLIHDGKLAADKLPDGVTSQVVSYLNSAIPAKEAPDPMRPYVPLQRIVDRGGLAGLKRLPR